MLTVWKYPLAVADESWVEMPADAELLYVAPTAATLLNLWARVDPSRPTVNRRIIMHGTGHPAGREPYIGSVVAEPFVWHVFDGGEEGEGDLGPLGEGVMS